MFPRLTSVDDVGIFFDRGLRGLRRCFYPCPSVPSVVALLAMGQSGRLQRGGRSGRLQSRLWIGGASKRCVVEPARRVFPIP